MLHETKNEGGQLLFTREKEKKYNEPQYSSGWWAHPKSTAPVLL
jgi:hypothetical protein